MRILSCNLQGEWRYAPLTEGLWNTRQWCDALAGGDREVARYYMNCPDF